MILWAVGRELDANTFVDGVGDQLEEVRADRRLAATNIDVEDLHLGELVDDRLHLIGVEFVRITATRRAEAVHAREVAAVGPLPRQTDRRVEAGLHLISEAGLLDRAQGRGRQIGEKVGHAASLFGSVSVTGSRKFDAASERNAL